MVKSDVGGEKEGVILKSQQDKLRELGIREFKEPIHLQDKEWLVERFGPGMKYPVNVSLLIRNIVWQARCWIMEGKIPPINGLVRNFWYSHIKIALSRSDSFNSSVDQCEQFTKQLVIMVRYNDLMRYKEMGFIDNNQNSQKVGINNHVILFAEKVGHFPLLERIASDTEVTIVSLGGQPSVLSAEYFVDRMKEEGIDVRKSFYLFSLVDYDTSGWIIKDAFVWDLRFYGIKHVAVEDLILPKIFSDEEIELYKYRLPESSQMKKKNRKWMARTGGINNQFYGLQADSAPTQRLENLFKEKTKELIGSTEPIRRARAEIELSEAIDKFILSKV
ncbi:MAG: hypothetical protein KKC11_05435 [Candidatus Omnitrophica bacterium]|nr:hypothetical protein [Candidatus Omnitrophota bacterium]MBU1134745.1 hypothetical protein [Candidatus Omnitrophota bacterium]MBU1366458.1 hypothetical protein [Candidatus Omnitrophota bacterium]MBU1524487.1 hypothetical protein [Candidatus Omnitrophota bacterium]MBU1811098.1 hypothetical protein [Candidatus Omnitrophota bacterium]